MPVTPRSLRTLAALLLTALAWLSVATPAHAAAAKPNILYILADDLGYGDISALNPSRGKIPTPHLDRLATQSMTFTDAHSGSSVCTPTRYGLLTGRYAWRTRLQKGVFDGGSDEPLIAADRLTLPAMLRRQGYTTACIGKWHLGFLADPAPPVPAGTKRAFGEAGAPVGSRIVGGPTTRGFDYFWGCSNARTMASLIEGDRVIENLPPVEMLPRLTQRAIDYLGTQAAAAKSGHPFFLYVALTSPHTPILPAPAWKGKSPLGAYGDFVMQTDATVGQILAALDRHGLADNTLVVFTSDNGCAVQAGVEKLEAAGHFASAQYRGYKADGWEGGHRVPFFVRWPGRVAPGTRHAALIGHGDFFATTAELLGVRLPATAAPDSVSFLPALRGSAPSLTRPALVHHSIKGQFSIREGRYKLIFGGGSGGYGKPGDADARAQGLPDAQLYDLRADPAETTNLIATHRAEATRLAALLHRIVADGRSTPGPAQSNDVAVILPALASITVSAKP
jgi:arylsulfatase A